MQVKVTDITLQMVKEVCNIINRGNEVTIKKERDNVVVVEIERHAVIKNTIEQAIVNKVNRG